MKTSDFDYHLPQEFIAQTPIEPRDHSRLLVINREDSSIKHHHFYDIVDFLHPGDVLVLNQSRVIPARLQGRRENGGKAEIFLLHRLEKNIWKTLVKPSKSIRIGSRIEIINSDSQTMGVSGIVLQTGEQGLRTIQFDDEQSLERLGQTPLPPYIHTSLDNPERYQTIYARDKGSVAAPTAGLHFTPQIFERFKEKGIDLAFITLHIGLDTFRPVREEDPNQHLIHSEYGEIPEEVACKLSQAKADKRRIICVGTTSMRLLEQAAQETDESLKLRPYAGWTDLFILPGYKFRFVDCMITNFHLPRSTLLMLVSAFAGKELIDIAYQEAIRMEYRFYSFGDAMIII